MSLRKYDGYIIHTGDDATLHFPNEAYVFKDLKEAFKDQEKVTVEIKTRRKPRSLSQNSVLHWYLNEIADETGMSPAEIKEAMRHLFLGVDMKDRNGEIVVDKATGEVIKTFRSTTDLSTVEFNTFTEEIRQWANNFLNLQLSLPNEETELRFTK